MLCGERWLRLGLVLNNHGYLCRSSMVFLGRVEGLLADDGKDSGVQTSVMGRSSGDMNP